MDATGRVLCRPPRATTSARRSIAVRWRERPPFSTAWPAKPAASAVVAHATLSVSQPDTSSSDSCIKAGIERVKIHIAILGRRAVIVRLATRALKALRASSISLRPRCARLTALTARIAIRFLAAIDGRAVLVVHCVSAKSVNHWSSCSPPFSSRRYGMKRRRRESVSMPGANALVVVTNPFETFCSASRTPSIARTSSAPTRCPGRYALIWSRIRIDPSPGLLAMMSRPPSPLLGVKMTSDQPSRTYAPAMISSSCRQ